MYATRTHIYIYRYIRHTHIYIYIYTYTSVDPNAYTCIHTKTTRSKEWTEQSKTCQHVWSPLRSPFRSPLRSQWCLVIRCRMHVTFSAVTNISRMPIRQLRLVGGISLTRRTGGNVRYDVEGIATACCYHNFFTISSKAQQVMVCVDRGSVIAKEA